jgi:DHA2 family multidrug resistance protein-like MFS transporter
MAKAELTGLAPPDAAAVTATLGSAIDIARRTGNEAAPWLATARDSYAAGFALCCLLASVTLLALAFIASRVYARADIDESRIGQH